MRQSFYYYYSTAVHYCCIGIKYHTDTQSQRGRRGCLGCCPARTALCRVSSNTGSVTNTPCRGTYILFYHIISFDALPGMRSVFCCFSVNVMGLPWHTWSFSLLSPVIAVACRLSLFMHHQCNNWKVFVYDIVDGTYTAVYPVRSPCNQFGSQVS